MSLGCTCAIGVVLPKLRKMVPFAALANFNLVPKAREVGSKESGTVSTGFLEA